MSSSLESRGLVVNAMPGEEPPSDELETLVEDVAKLRDDLRGSDFSPVVAEFAGSPKSGKSTTIDIVSHLYKRVGFSVYAPSEGASKRSPYALRKELVAFNSWTMNYAISELLVSYHAVDRPDLILLDRGPFDSLAWMRVMKKQGRLSDEDFEVIERFVLLPIWSELVSRIYIFTCDPEISLKREHEAKLVKGPGTAMNPETLSDLFEEYNAVRNQLDAYPMKPIVTSDDTSPKSTSAEIATDIRDLLRLRLETG
jgi:hypothetical protein